MKIDILSIFITINLLFISCNNNSENKLEVIKNNSSLVYDDDFITHKNLIRFFSNDSLLKKYKITIENSEIKELMKLKNEINTSFNKKNFQVDIGIYEYALIFENDTLFTSSDLKKWRYKDRVSLYQSDIITKLLKKTN